MVFVLGPGTTIESVKHCTDTLRRLLSPYYAILNVTGSTLISEPWAASTSLLVIPGGADLPFCRELDGKGNAAITKYVRNGGRYLGLCAGGYYGSSRVEFEVGNLEMEVSGSRELKFFPGIARGAVFKGFQYGTQVNAKAAKIQVITENLPIKNKDVETTLSKNPVYTYVDGGCLFVDAENFKQNGIEVLARYLDPLDISGSDESKGDNIDAVNPAATVYCPVGKGCAILTGLHPEFTPDLLKRIPSNERYTQMVSNLEAANGVRVEFMKSLLQKMGLKVNPQEIPIPSLSRLYLTSAYPPSLKHLVEKWREDIGFGGKHENEMDGTNDKFRIWDASHQEKYTTSNTLTDANEELKDTDSSPIDLDKIIKDIDVYYQGLPDTKLTPVFNHKLYYNSLEQYRKALGPGVASNMVGTSLLYGEVVTSTSTMLFKNYKVLRTLPTGFTAVGNIQVAGRGRANNVWVSPLGVLAFSTVLRMPLHNDYGLPSPMVFVQYLAAIAIVESIRTYARVSLGIADFPVYIKWPNDVYILNTTPGSKESHDNKYYKASGILVNTTVLDGEYFMVIGIGINVDNAAPSKSLNTFIDEINDSTGRSYGHFEAEPLLARFMSIWEQMLRDFAYQGFAPFEGTYYDLWLHSNKIVTLEQYGNTKAIIRGISKDFGMLIAEEVDRNNTPLGKTFELQPDGNSFDMLKGLLKKKT